MVMPVAVQVIKHLRSRHMSTTSNLDGLRKRIAWRAVHRGMRELDLVLGQFAAARLANLSVEDLATFEKLLDVPDQIMLDWLMGQASVPPEFQSNLLNDIRSFRPQKPS
jgi:antitoxin CptB